MATEPKTIGSLFPIVTTENRTPNFFGNFAMTAEIPAYRALERIELQPAGASRPRVIKVGEEFNWYGEPGLELMPLNDAARALKLERIQPHHYARRSVVTQRMARSLGFTGHDVNSARDFIQNFVAHESARQTAAPTN
jgi:hypothetical protein